jgi:hypothetical protein
MSVKEIASSAKRKVSTTNKLSLEKYTLQRNLSFYFQLSHLTSNGGGARRDVSENTKCKMLSDLSENTEFTFCFCFFD